MPSDREIQGPEVSIVIPTRDRWRFLSGALDSALGQEEVSTEVLVVDDCSTDETVKRLAALDEPRLRTIRNNRSIGVTGARNRGAEAARGGWLAFLDDDDLWSPRKLRVQLDTAGDADWVYAAALVVDANRLPLRIAARPPDPEGIRTALLSRNVMPAGSSNVLMKTELFRRVGGFDEQLLHLADWDLWLRLSEKARPAASSEVLVAYTHHLANMMLQDPEGVLSDLDYLASKHLARCMAAGVDFDRLAIYRWIAWGHRRAGNRSKAVATYLRAAQAERSPGDVLRAIGAAIGERAMRGARSPDGMAMEHPDWLRSFER